MQKNIVLYSTHCPLCKGLEKALNNKNIIYSICTDIEQMKELGIKSVPVLSVDGELMRNKDALKWVASQE
jgi:predicted DCC family thiol-disulfide oxidoreductase YuxK